MTNHKLLYVQAQSKLLTIPTGPFRLSDLVDNPPANLGRIFGTDVLRRRYPNVKRVGVDERSAIYEKLWM